jgi:hypothetical protein
MHVLKIGLKSTNRLLIAISSLVIVLLATWVVARTRANPTSSANHRLGIPSLIDLGSIDDGTLIPVRIDVTNPGQSTVTLTDFKASCSCMSVYQESSSSPKVAIEKLTVSPLAHTTILIDVRVGGDAGSRQASTVSFRDAAANDVYSVAITYTPVASLYSIPKSVSFGGVAVGERATQRVEIRSRSRVENGAVRVDGPGLKSVATTLVGATSRQTEEFDADNPGQHLVGYLDVTLNPAMRASNVRETVSIVTDGLTTLEIPVAAEIVGEYTLLPNHIVLPRQSSAGTLYSARLACRSQSASGFTVELAPTKAPFRVATEQPSESHPNRAVVNLEYVGALPQADSEDYELTFNVTESARQYTLSCSIRVLKAPP